MSLTQFPRLNRKIYIIEARNRAGGRTHTVSAGLSDNADVKIDVGGQWVNIDLNIT